MDETIRYKLFRLALPLPFFAAAFTAVYSAANWYLVAASGLVPIDEDLVTFWLPFALACLLVAFLVAPHIRVLDIQGKRNDPKFLYQLAAVAVIAVPAILAQVYVKDASGTLTHVKDARLIGSVPASKYYVADTICVDRRQAKGRTAVWTMGRNEETLEVGVYVVAPLCGENIRAPAIWIGEEFTHSIDNRQSMAAKNAAYNAFLRKTQKDYYAEDMRGIRYLQRAGVNFARRNFDRVLHDRGASASAILVPHTDVFAARTGNSFVWIFRTLGIGAAIWFVVIMLTPADYGKVANKLTDEEVAQAAAEKATSGMLFVPRPGFYGLPILFDINLGVFLVMVASGLGVVAFQVDDLVGWGAQYGPLLHGWGWLRMITSQFLHWGLMHILQNMYGLLVAGFFLTVVMRNWGLIVAYLICGLAGNIAGYIVHPNTVSAGASGAIMGLWGILVALAVLNDPRIAGGRGIVLINAAIFAGLTLALGGAALPAHLGGFAAGVVIGGVVTLFRPKVVEEIPA